MTPEQEAKEWLEKNEHKLRPKKKRPYFTAHSKYNSNRRARLRRARQDKSRLAAAISVKEFVESSVGHKGCDCLFVPAAQKGVAAKVTRFEKQMTAARYMLILTQGTPPTDGLVCRHRCGNGHLSCVNPAHLCWGTPGDNVADANRHRKAGDNIQDRIHSIPD